VIALRCPDCQAEFQRPDGDGGKTVFCPKCYFMFVVPQSAQSVPAAPETRFQSASSKHDVPAQTVTDDYVVVCPICRGTTDSLKAIEIRNIVFLYVFIVWNREYIIGCPKCVRDILLSRILTAIPASNLLFPIYGLIYLLQYVEAGSKGHSDPGVAHGCRMTRSQYHELAQIEKPVRGAGSWVVVAILVLFICGIAYMVISRLMRGW